MAMDKQQQRLKIGDIVHVPCEVVQIGLGEDHHNLLLLTVDQMPGGTERTQISVNSRQTILKQRPASASPTPAATPDVSHVGDQIESGSQGDAGDNGG